MKLYIPIKMRFKNVLRERIASKYIAYFFAALFTILLCGQLLAQLYTVRQLNKVSGKIIYTEQKVTGFGGGGRKRGEPQYSFIITLDNKQAYYIDLDGDNGNLIDILHKGDNVTIYNPTKLYNLLSLDGLDFERRVSQVEVDNKIVTSFAHHQKKARSLIAILLLGIALCCYFLYDWYINNKKAT